jgi:sigma-E factor negative regulatory protein RseB
MRSQFPVNNRFNLKLFSRWILGVIVLVTVAAVLRTEPVTAATSLTAAQWLDKMQGAITGTDYRGTFVYTRGKSVSTMSIVHRIVDGVEQERLLRLDGDKSEIIRKGADVVCILPDNRMVRLEQATPVGKIATAFKHLESLRKHYMISLTGEDRVAGIPAVKIAVMARDDYRYSYLLWLDKTSGFLLKSLTTDARGVVMERFQYTSFAYANDLTDKDFIPSIKGKIISHEDIPETRADESWTGLAGWRADWLPAGFRSLERSGKKNGHVQVFSDGLATVSIFIEKPNAGNMPQGVSKIGATVACARERNWKGHQYMVTVVGEVPAQTAMKIADSVMPELN